MKIFFAIVSLAPLLTLGTAGCLVIPVPHSNSGYARTNVVAHTPEQFVPGQTTREAVILALGEPDAVSRDERELAYRSEKVVAVWIIAAASQGAGGATGGDIYKNNFYIFEFDPNGLYQTNRQTGQYGLVQGAQETQLRGPALASAGANDVLATIAGQSVRREYPQCLWLPGGNVARALWNGYVGQPGHLFCSESNLVFTTESQFVNTESALTVPYASISEIRVYKRFFGQWLIVGLKAGEAHAFLINTAGGIWQDKSAMQAVCDFIQDKIKSAPVQP